MIGRQAVGGLQPTSELAQSKVEWGKKLGLKMCSTLISAKLTQWGQFHLLGLVHFLAFFCCMSATCASSKNTNSASSSTFISGGVM